MMDFPDTDVHQIPGTSMNKLHALKETLWVSVSTPERSRWTM